MNKKGNIRVCKNCRVRFMPSATAMIKDMCHACIMANL